MLKRMNLGMVMVVGFAFISGCATTGRNYQPDIDSLNSRITSLQAELSSKDQEIKKLQTKLGDQASALVKAESEKRDLSDRLSSAVAKLDAASKKPAENPDYSDIK
ncbi:MAG: hypothetical protein AUJ72_01595 [Candidatus Omnitrophica bacterium CG1_02_46_14]|nr:MAG: hypothetical protein AUJ72_01595 [Candidatus Omnitrophica bacterium CG1_02_46_14]